MASGQNSAAGSGSASTPIASQSVRQKSDIAWGHVSLTTDANGKKIYTCLYCHKSAKGGGINRMKQHLAKKTGEIGACKKVPYDVQFQMEESFKTNVDKRQEAQERYERNNPYGPSLSQFEGDNHVEEDCQEVPPPNKKQKGVFINETGKRNRPTGSFFAPRATSGAQPSIRSALANKQIVHNADMAVARWLYDACIPFNSVTSVYYQPALDAVAAVGPGYKGPSYHAMRVSLLKEMKREVQLFVDSLKSKWEVSGCTKMGDGWTDTVGQRTLINFLVYCPTGMVFVKSVDASAIVKDAFALFKLFDEVIEWVGPSSVVHMVTDNGSNYVAARRMICEKYKTIDWSPCACHCLNLVLKDIEKLQHVHDLALRAFKITVYLYNHIFLLSWLSLRPGWKEIIRPGLTRFATTFLALKSLYDHRHDLQDMATSKVFVDSRYAREKKAKVVASIILDNKFWNDCFIIVQIAAPLIRLLRVADSDERPAIGYIYEGMHRAKLGIKKLFKFKKRLYKTYTKIIKERWDRQLRKSIHAAAYWLNPAFQYEKDNFCDKSEVMHGLLDVIENKATSSKKKLLDETKLFRDRLESFGRELAYTSSKEQQPDEWWRLFGGSAPNLQKLAIRILGQTSSSSGCERNWSVFDRIHSKKRNRLEHQRLNDLAFVQYNLRLKNRDYYKRRTYDPIDYECIDKTEFWIVEDGEETPFLDYDEIERMLYEDLSNPETERRRAQEDLFDRGGDLDIQEGLDLGSFDPGDESDVEANNGGASTSARARVNVNNRNEDDDEDWLRGDY